jgi:proteasome lid subunit RPN8/RPN11
MVRLPNDIDRQIRFVAEKAYPEEGCGMLLGSYTEGIYYVHEIIEFLNATSLDRTQRYLITAAQYRSAERTALEKHLSIVGVFHSHPDHEPYPTPFDIEQALPHLAYLILAVNGRLSGTMTSWVLDENRLRFAHHTLELSR